MGAGLWQISCVWGVFPVRGCVKSNIKMLLRSGRVVDLANCVNQGKPRTKASYLVGKGTRNDISKKSPSSAKKVAIGS